MKTKRLKLLNRLANRLRELSLVEDLATTYDWFSIAIRENGLTDAEQFRVAMTAGFFHASVVVPTALKAKRAAPWVTDIDVNSIYARTIKSLPTVLKEPQPRLTIIDEAEHLVPPGEYTKLLNRAKVKSENPHTAQPRLTNKCLNDARKLLGAPPYNKPGNYVAGDSYFSRSCSAEHGEQQWNAACELVLKEIGE